VSKRIVKILMERDKVTEEEAKRTVKLTRELVNEAIENGDDPDEIMMAELGLEPDYLDDLIF